MDPILLLGNNHRLNAALQRRIRFLGGTEPLIIPLPQGLDGDDIAPDLVMRSFEEIADQIETYCPPDGPRRLSRAIGVMDPGRGGFAGLDDLNPLSTVTGVAALAGMLILAFPEIHWVFPFQVPDPSAMPAVIPFEKVHVLSARNPIEEVLALHTSPFSPLFDPTGLRGAIRSGFPVIRNAPGEATESLAPVRRELAATIDEEKSYAYFNAYIAYRFFYRALPVTSYHLLRAAFGKECNPSPVSLVFEDFYLAFPDLPDGQQLHRLTTRQKAAPGLHIHPFRIGVTAGHGELVGSKITDPLATASTVQDNLNYYARLALDGRVFSRLLYKPFSGIFDVWRNSGLQDKLGSRSQRIEAVGVSPNVEADQVLHSAPGRLLQIADRLLTRAECLYRCASSVPDAVCGATLAMDAEEYLGTRTPTEALRALVVRHKLEVMAECSFYGVGAEINVDDRLAEISDSIREIGIWFDGDQRRIAELRTEIKIVGELIALFRSFNQFDEEQKCLSKQRHLLLELQRERAVRKYQRSLGCESGFGEYTARRVCGMLSSIRLLVSRYVISLLGDLRRFALAIAAWIISLTSFYTWCCPAQKGKHVPLHGLSDAINAFISLQPPHELLILEPSWVVLVVTLAAIVVGILHLGIFLSHVYSVVVRR